jgi:LmbE family N-acetylglucosaminyl deacetylase
MSTAKDSELLDALCEGKGSGRAPRVLLVAAHPDDDVVGAGGRIPWLAPALHVAYVTDGAPRDPKALRDAGFADRDAYATTRRREARKALLLAGVPEERVHAFGEIDQEASSFMVRIAEQAAALVRELRPEAVLTHAYEGGHPDHDATALAVHAASALLARDGVEPPALLEFAEYHEEHGHMVFGAFPPEGPDGRAVVLDPAQRELKERLFACHESQRAVLRQFPTDRERYRVAPAYVFERRAAAALYYERFDWKMTGERFEVLAREALRSLGIASPC